MFNEEKAVERMISAAIKERLEILASWLRFDVETCFPRSIDGTRRMCEEEVHLNRSDYPPCIRCQTRALAVYLKLEIPDE